VLVPVAVDGFAGTSPAPFNSALKIVVPLVVLAVSLFEIAVLPDVVVSVLELVELLSELLPPLHERREESSTPAANNLIVLNMIIIF
jgi:hypothetical protein